MREYAVTTRQATLTAGRVRLTKEQARPRAHALKATEAEGVYEVVGEIHFKGGETFGWDQKLPKALADDLTAHAEEKAAEKTAKAHLAKLHKLDDKVKAAREALDAEKDAEKREPLVLALEKALTARQAAE